MSTRKSVADALARIPRVDLVDAPTPIQPLGLMTQSSSRPMGSGRYRGGSSVVFLMTGGTPALFAYRRAFARKDARS
jgi:1-aminocyclopropane-1-carboxylate deaminase/D-cysteine desulfhydrase-like pyridoxal-dependent ACC family enzyme